MAKIKQIGMAAGTFSVALGIGFVMQNGDALASRFGSDPATTEPAAFAEEIPADVVQASAIEPSPAVVMPTASPEAPIVTQNASIALPDAIVEPDVADLAVVLPQDAQVAPPQDAPVQIAALDPELAPVLETDAALSEPIACVPEMAGIAGAGATLKIAVMAPCHADTSFTVHHQGMMFTGLTDAAGQASLVVPALAEVAVVIAAFDSGDGAVATVTIPDFANYDRAVLQWQGDAAVMLSAYEGDAGFGDVGHIHSENTGDLERLIAAEGGYLMQLGDASVEGALMAEVYTFPSGMAPSVSDVMLVAEAEITSDNCGEELSAQSIQVFPTGDTAALDLTMVMPACDAVGDILILQNMFEDLTLAMR